MDSAILTSHEKGANSSAIDFEIGTSSVSASHNDYVLVPPLCGFTLYEQNTKDSWSSQYPLLTADVGTAEANVETATNSVGTAQKDQSDDIFDKTLQKYERELDKEYAQTVLDQYVTQQQVAQALHAQAVASLEFANSEASATAVANALAAANAALTYTGTYNIVDLEDVDNNIASINAQIGSIQTSLGLIRSQHSKIIADTDFDALPDQAHYDVYAQLRSLGNQYASGEDTIRSLEQTRAVEEDKLAFKAWYALDQEYQEAVTKSIPGPFETEKNKQASILSGLEGLVASATSKCNHRSR